MQTNEKGRTRFSGFGTLKVMVAASFLAALSIVLGKYLAFNIGTLFRLSFENLPIILAATSFGPFVGAAVGIVADLVGCLMVGYDINPIVTVGAGAIGLISGVLYRLPVIRTLPSSAKLAATIAAAHLVGSVIIKSIGLAAYYTYPLPILMLWRALNYLAVGIAEAFVLYLLYRSRAVTRQIEALKK